MGGNPNPRPQECVENFEEDKRMIAERIWDKVFPHGGMPYVLIEAMMALPIEKLEEVETEVDELKRRTGT